MALVARASSTVRNKNLLIILMCAVFLCWFGYDGFVGYPKNDDRLVAFMRAALAENKISSEFADTLKNWTTWDAESPDSRKRMDDVVNSSKNRVQLEGWKSVSDVWLQRTLVYCLAAATAGAVWWFFHCQKRRAIAEDATVSPAPGITVPWDKITKVDNTRWKSTGIVEITFPGDDGKPRKAKFDDYELDREPLLSILDQLAEKAVNAEFIPKEDPVPPTPQESAPA